MVLFTFNFLRVYCKYHYLEGHEFKTPEAELREFLSKMMKLDWKFYEQYPSDESDESSSDDRKSLIRSKSKILLNHNFTCS